LRNEKRTYPEVDELSTPDLPIPLLLVAVVGTTLFVLQELSFYLPENGVTRGLDSGHCVRVDR
jgi:hypothetical protein